MRKTFRAGTNDCVHSRRRLTTWYQMKIVIILGVFYIYKKKERERRNSHFKGMAGGIDFCRGGSFHLKPFYFFNKGGL